MVDSQNSICVKVKAIFAPIDRSLISDAVCLTPYAALHFLCFLRKDVIKNSLIFHTGMNRKTNRAIFFSATIITMLLGIMVITGWLIHNDFLRELFPGQVRMKFNAALCFILSSFALLLKVFAPGTKTWTSISALLSAIVFLIGLVTLTEYITGINYGIDELFVRDELPTTALYYAGRMSPLSAVNFLLIGTGLFLLNKEKTAGWQFYYLFSIAFIALLMLIGFNFIVDIPTYIRLGIYTAIAFITLPAAIWFAQPQLQMKIGFERKLFTGFIAIIILMALLSIFSSYYSAKRTSTSDLIDHTNIVLSEAEQVLSLTKDIESGDRGYIITRDTNYLDYFFIAKKTIFGHITRLKELTTDNPVQQVRADSLSALITKKIDFSLQCIELTNNKGFDAAKALMDTRMGKFYTDEIRKVISAIQQEEKDLLVSRQKESDKSLVSFNRAFFVFLAFVSVLLVVILFSIRNNISIRKKAENQSRESSEQIETIFRAAPDAVIVIDDKGKVIKWNAMSETVFGWTAGEVLGKSLTETIIPHRYREAHQKGMNRFLQTGEGPVLGKTIEIQALTKTNREFDIALSISPTRINEQQLFIGFIRDITERRKSEEKLRESEEKFQKSFQASAAGISITQLSNGAYMEVNDAFANMTGYSKEALVGHTSTELGLIVNHARREEVLQQIREQGSAKNFEMTVRSKSGKILEVLASVETVVLSGEKYAINVIYDITDRKKAEKELETVNKELEAFSYSVSHDLRGPLRIIDGYTRILIEDYAGKLDEEGNRMLGIVTANAQKMGQLIDDLLNFSRLGRKQLIIHRVDMNGLVESVIAEQQLSNEKLLAIQIDTLEPAYCDNNLIQQVWINFISNAIKYSSQQEKPVIEIKSVKTADEIIYSIKDNGVGFDMKYAGKLFGVFQRLHDMRDFEGTGVGLALVQRIINRHGGRVWAEGEVNAGATFYFSLPIFQDKIKIIKPSAP